MAAKIQTWAANNRQIARVLGLKPKPAQLKEIGAWFKLPGFPKKQARGYPVAELLIWYGNHLKEKKSEVRGQRSENRSQKSDLRPPTSDLPPRPDAPGEGKELFETPEQQFARRLDHLQDKYLNPERYETKIAQWEVAELRRHRPEIWDKATAAESGVPAASATYPKFVDGMDNLGALIVRRFREFPSIGEVSRQRIQNWKAFVGVTKRADLIPFPTPTTGNRYETQPCFDWVEKFIIPDLSKHQGELMPFGAAKEEMEQIALRRAKREELFSLGSLIPYAAAKNYVNGIGSRLAKHFDRIEDRSGFQRSVIEDLMEILQKAAASAQPELLAAFSDRLAARCTAFNDALKSEFGAGAKSANEELEKIRREQQEAG